MTHLVVLAAGMGRRIGELTGDGPKVLLPLPTGRSLLAQNLCNALGSGAVTRASVITGHGADSVVAAVASHEHVGRIRTLHNPEYATAGPIRSLLEARAVLRAEDVIIINGDTFYRSDAFGALDRAGAGLFLAYSRVSQDHDDVEVILAEDGRLARVGKRLGAAARDGISAGLFLVRGEAARERFASMLDRFEADGRARAKGYIWHDLVHELAGAGAGTAAGVGAVEIDVTLWREVDTPADYEALCASLAAP